MDRYEKSIENKYEVKPIDICQFWFIFTTHHNFNPFFASFDYTNFFGTNNRTRGREGRENERGHERKPR